MYLADLLDYAVRHVRYNGAPITVSWLARRFHQPFDRLPAACEWVERKIPQIRIAIEVLRAEAQSSSAMPGYLSLAYELLLQGIGTSLEELRGLMKAGPDRERRQLAERLGIVLTPIGPGGTDELDALYAHGHHPPSEATLEGLFGLRDTNRDPLDPDVQPAVLVWRLAFLNRRWYAEDWPQQVPPGTPAFIDPDLVGQADIAETSPNVAPNRATDFWQARESQLDIYRAELVEFLTGPTPGALDLLFQNVDQTRRPLIRALGPTSAKASKPANLHPMPNGDIGAVSWYTTPRVTNADVYDELSVVYTMLYWSTTTGELTPRWTAYSGTAAKLGDPPKFLNDLNGKPSTWQLRPEDRYYTVVGTFQPRVVLLNVQRRTAALLMDRRVVWQTEGQFEAEDGRDGNVWPIQDGDSILAAFTDEQGTPLLLFSNPGFGRLGLISVIGDRLRTRWMGSGRIPAPGAQAGQGWTYRPTARFAFGDLDMDGNRELITITPAEAGTGELALLHLLPGPVSRGLALKTGMPSRHGLSGIPSQLIRLDYPPRLSAAALADRRTQAKTAYEQTIRDGAAAALRRGERNLIYLDEALYFVPVEIALRLSSSGRYTLALDWFRAVYEYDRAGGPLPVIHKLVSARVG